MSAPLRSAAYDQSMSERLIEIALQPDGKILVGGVFVTIGGQPRNRIARLDPMTGLADSFNPNADNYVRAIEVQPDGKSMRVTYTWTDPKIFAKPYTYRLIFDRAPGDVTYALDEWCDASDPVEGQSIVPPKQKVIK